MVRADGVEGCCSGQRKRGLVWGTCHEWRRQDVFRSYIDRAFAIQDVPPGLSRPYGSIELIDSTGFDYQAQLASCITGFNRSVSPTKILVAIVIAAML